MKRLKRSMVKGFIWETGMMVFCILSIWLFYLWWSWNGLLGSVVVNGIIYIVKLSGFSLYDWIWENTKMKKWLKK